MIKLFREGKWAVPLGSLFGVKAGKPDLQIAHRERLPSPGAPQLIENREEEKGARGEGVEARGGEGKRDISSPTLKNWNIPIVKTIAEGWRERERENQTA